jgi:hypothetical protein
MDMFHSRFPFIWHSAVRETWVPMGWIAFSFFDSCDAAISVSTTLQQREELVLTTCKLDLF